MPPDSNKTQKLNFAPQRLMPVSREIISPGAGTKLPMDGTTHAQLWRSAVIRWQLHASGKLGNFLAGIAEGIWPDLFALYNYTPRSHGSFIPSSPFLIDKNKTKQSITLYRRHVAISRQHVFGGPCIWFGCSFVCLWQYHDSLEKFICLADPQLAMGSPEK